MDSYIKISTLNDFIFCPKSIYFHQLYENYEKEIYQEQAQIKWTLNHARIDQGRYSTSKDILQWISIYSEKYNLAGKIDVFHIAKKSLMERKSHIEKVYQGYIYQLYAQYFCLKEMGYEIEKLKLYSMDDNQVFEIPLPDEEETRKFEDFLKKYRDFDLSKAGFVTNPEKCARCIYKELCDSYQA